MPVLEEQDRLATKVIQPQGSAPAGEMVFGRHGQQERIAAQRFALDLAQIAFEGNKSRL